MTPLMNCLSFQEMHDVLVTVESSPPFLCCLSELEHHGQAGAPASRSPWCGAGVAEWWRTSIRWGW